MVLIKQTYQEILSTDPKLELIQFLSNRELFLLLTSTSYGKTVITTGKSVLKLNLLSLKVIYLKWVNIQLLASLWPLPYIQTSLCKCATLSQGAKKIIFSACRSGKLKLTFTSPDVISTSPKSFFEVQNWSHCSSVIRIPLTRSLAHRAS